MRRDLEWTHSREDSDQHNADAALDETKHDGTNNPPGKEGLEYRVRAPLIKA